MALLTLAAACRTPREHGFRCSDGTVFTAQYLSDSVMLRLPQGTATLPLALSGSGARYANDTLEFWEHGGEARVSRRGAVLHEACRPAQRATVDL